MEYTMEYTMELELIADVICLTNNLKDVIYGHFMRKNTR